MTDVHEPRIDILRKMIAVIGARQAEYYKFFPTFADMLEEQLGAYLGDPSSVALSCATGPFDFESGSYRHGGLGLENGRFRIPLMFRFANLQDDGELLVRFNTYYSLDGGDVLAEVGGRSLIRFQKDDLSRLFEEIFQYLQHFLSVENWLCEQGADYSYTKIGFVHGGN